ncbi:hypothetical protein RvY_07407-1 [Ramazzottius varieornatus]|uniref:Cytochrome b5 heme-binding domain-containing protein n=1 Tax=Ramazzottius varieornatus TaxID=947166 RepID=A0A1D1V860_RAMVA|nr:hypothetical protein RvY_07407-1 [Ramazzottius varieornatus]
MWVWRPKMENISPNDGTIRSASTTQYSLKEVSMHSHYSSCWITIRNKIYDITDYLAEHPGGAEIILEFAGYDATSAFFDKGHSREAIKTLEKYCIGELTLDDRLYAEIFPATSRCSS